MRVVMCAIVVTFGLAACGEADEPAATADPDRPVQAPAEPSAPATTPAPKADCKRLSRRLVGRRLPQAESMARKRRCPLRVAIKDGRNLALTEDFSPSRINVRVDDGVVTEIVGLF
jgi:hypothetical protein